MNLAQHALKQMAADPLEKPYSQTKRSRPKKSVKDILVANRHHIIKWAEMGMPASMMSPRLDCSTTSYWQHIHHAVSRECIALIKANGGKSNRDNNYKNKINQALSPIH